THGDHPAVAGEAWQRTYAELDQAASEAAAGLAEGERVLAPARPDLEFVVLVHATARAGAVFVPLNPRLTEREAAARRDVAGAVAARRAARGPARRRAGAARPARVGRRHRTARPTDLRHDRDGVADRDAAGRRGNPPPRLRGAAAARGRAAHRGRRRGPGARA